MPKFTIACTFFFKISKDARVSTFVYLFCGKDTTVRGLIITVVIPLLQFGFRHLFQC